MLLIVAHQMLAVRPLTDVGDWARGNGLEIVLIILGTILIARVIRWAGARVTAGIEERDDESDELVRSETAKHRHALTQVVSWAVLALLYTGAAILIVGRLGVPLAGFVAPATVVGVALGFGAQRIVQDVLAGFFVIAERQYGFGDLIRMSVVGVALPVLGTVEDVSLRITTVRTSNGEVIITPNGQIVQVTNLSRDWARAVIDVPVPLTADVSRVSELLRVIGLQAFADADLHGLLLDAPAVMGVESIELDQFAIRLVARTLPGKQFEVSRALRARISHKLSTEGLRAPPDHNDEVGTAAAVMESPEETP